MATLSVASKIISYLQVKENTQVSPAKTQVSLSRYLVATLSVASKIISYLQVKENTQVTQPRHRHHSADILWLHYL